MILMYADWFCEINAGFDKTIKILVREASEGVDDMSVTPLVNAPTNRKGYRSGHSKREHKPQAR